MARIDQNTEAIERRTSATNCASPPPIPRNIGPESATLLNFVAWTVAVICDAVTKLVTSMFDVVILQRPEVFTLLSSGTPTQVTPGSPVVVFTNGGTRPVAVHV